MKLFKIFFFSLFLILIIFLLGTQVQQVEHIDQNRRTDDIESTHPLTLGISALQTKIRLIDTKNSLKTSEKSILSFEILDYRDRPITDLVTHHDRKVHVIIISEDMEIFGHVHPEDFDLTSNDDIAKGIHRIEFAFPKGGDYIVAVDIMTKTGMFSEQFKVTVEGYEKLGAILKDFKTQKLFKPLLEDGKDRYPYPVMVDELTDREGDHFDVSFMAPQVINVGEDVTFKYNFMKDGKPVTDFTPYLAAPMHFAIINNDFNRAITKKGEPPGFIHAHGGPKGFSELHCHEAGVPKSFGPDIELVTKIPGSGTYTIFGQIKHKDRILFTKFMFKVGS